MSDNESNDLDHAGDEAVRTLLSPSHIEVQPRRFELASEVFNFLLVLLIGPVALAAVLGWSSEAGPAFKVSHECRYLDPSATQCWNHLKIISMNDQPVTIERVVVNGRSECTAGADFLGLAKLMASQFINVNEKTLNKGDAYGVGMSCEPVDVQIETNRGTWRGGSR